ncbi:low affinity immunoglobulin epsilon Fc receptor isoform X2 [Spodoptera frugiperda]|uniref:Low affinity immunoglobulin epsilon Fc receptor isoform X2 n=1 Tax=Spodoptera frugiperda TaxID=7108 RepID=A0A9R0D998_SPOFR|nr:low affinity immunoglobulin epsilon Fc receptor isoform X2 [Spodoptera frugiperda]
MNFFFGKNIPSVLLMSLVILANAQRRDVDMNELERQNKITQQILEAFIQKKLGLRSTVPKAPSILDILPVKMPTLPVTQQTDTETENIEEDNNDPIDNQELTEDQNIREDDSLQSVESEQIDSIYNTITECSSCNDDDLGVTRWTMPLLKSGEKKYYLGIFFKANWFKAQQYCRFHGMHLASISSQQENDKLEQYVKDSGFGREHFWTSGTDLAEEGSFFWMANGRPLTFVNWNAGEPNNFRYENGEEENCLELWNRDDKGLKWNDSPCSFETFFICEVRSD